jgi:MYXO-CTERM domain-containing protein
MKTKLLLLAVVTSVICHSGFAQTTYNGNGSTGFGGAIGNGTLTLSNNSTTVFGTLTTGSTIDNAFVLYIDAAAGGFTSTAGFNDDGDQLRSAISGYTATGNGGGPGQSVLTFESGFAPNYAIALQPSDGVDFGGLWSMANGGANSLPYIDSVNLSPTGTDAQGAYTFSFPLAEIGLTAGQSFEIFGTYVSDTGYRSSETIAGNDTGTQGWSPYTQTSYATFITVPEPSSLILGAAGFGALVLIRRRRI